MPISLQDERRHLPLLPPPPLSESASGQKRALSLATHASGEHARIGRLNGSSRGAVSAPHPQAKRPHLKRAAVARSVKHTSPLGHMVAGTVKGAVQSLIAPVVFGTATSAREQGGTLVCLLGSAWYAWLRMRPATEKRSD